MPVRLAALTLASSLLMFSAVAHADEAPLEGGAIRPFRVGALVGTGAPSLASGQLLLQYKSYLAVTADFGVTPTIHLPLGTDVAVRGHGFSGSARVRPFRGDVFVAVAFGSQRFDGAVENPYDRSTIHASTSTVYVMPQVGFLHRFHSGFSLGADLGVELPLSAKLDDGGLPSQAHDAMHTFATSPIPVLNLLRLGYVL